MQKKSLVRLLMVVLLATASIFVIASVHADRPHDPSHTEEGTGGGSDERCGQGQSQGEFIIWESLSRSLLASTGR